MKIWFSHYVAKLQRFFQRKKVVEKIIEPKESKTLVGMVKVNANNKVIVFDFRIQEGQKLSLSDHLKRYHECADSLLKEQYLIDMYNDGFIDEAIEVFENKNGLIVIDKTL
ncbi:hypothetical protein HX096_06025 [Empedobacter falsenii]|uniref:hypothetical protein n=1 Tax=Empedobacter falsenii TaxID=343874 RepID=UPI002577C9C2|nr:hypothetical protein [Empedobacter falsenii]MDM1547417.1 hypothetical protein [Empedobacter falsenii]